jgi:hypothetical protein
VGHRGRSLAVARNDKLAFRARLRFRRPGPESARRALQPVSPREPLQDRYRGRGAAAGSGRTRATRRQGVVAAAGRAGTRAGSDRGSAREGHYAAPPATAFGRLRSRALGGLFMFLPGAADAARRQGGTSAAAIAPLSCATPWSASSTLPRASSTPTPTSATASSGPWSSVSPGTGYEEFRSRRGSSAPRQRADQA